MTSTLHGRRGAPARTPLAVLAAAVLAVSACSPADSADVAVGAAVAEASPPAAPSVASTTPEDAGRYIVEIGGCNDCHTPGYMESPDNATEANRLTGMALGFRGPWGTSYPPNLRLSARNMSEDEWATMLRTRRGLPPMPWPAVNHLSDADARALHRYLLSLGPSGVASPVALPPGVEPTTPWMDFTPKNVPAAVAGDR